MKDEGSDRMSTNIFLVRRSLRFFFRRGCCVKLGGPNKIGNEIGEKNYHGAEFNEKLRYLMRIARIQSEALNRSETTAVIKQSGASTTFAREG